MFQTSTPVVGEAFHNREAVLDEDAEITNLLRWLDARGTTGSKPARPTRTKPKKSTTPRR